MSPCPAIPTTRVAKINGAIIIFTILRNISAKGCILTAIEGASQPKIIPKTSAKNIKKVNFDAAPVFLPVCAINSP